MAGIDVVVDIAHYLDHPIAVIIEPWGNGREFSGAFRVALRGLEPGTFSLVNEPGRMAVWVEDGDTRCTVDVAGHIVMDYGIDIDPISSSIPPSLNEPLFGEQGVHLRIRVTNRYSFPINLRFEGEEAELDPDQQHTLVGMGGGLESFTLGFEGERDFVVTV